MCCPITLSLCGLFQYLKETNLINTIVQVYGAATFVFTAYFV